MKLTKAQIKLHTWHIVFLLVIVLTLGSIGLGLIIKTNPWTNAFDHYFYELIHKGPNYPWLDALIKPFNFNFLPRELSPFFMPSYYYFMFLITAFYVVLFKRTEIFWAIFCFVFGTILAYQVTAIDWIFVFRERPFVTLPNDVDAFGKMAWEKLSSYPSGHARETTLYGIFMYHFIPQIKWLMIAFIIFIAYSRIYIGAHYPTDVIAAVMIGFLTAKITLLIVRELKIIWGKRVKGGKNDQQSKQSVSHITKS